MTSSCSYMTLMIADVSVITHDGICFRLTGQRKRHIMVTVTDGARASTRGYRTISWSSEDAVMSQPRLLNPIALAAYRRGELTSDQRSALINQADGGLMGWLGCGLAAVIMVPIVLVAGKWLSTQPVLGTVILIGVLIGSTLFADRITSVPMRRRLELPQIEQLRGQVVWKNGNYGAQAGNRRVRTGSRPAASQWLPCQRSGTQPRRTPHRTPNQRLAGMDVGDICCSGTASGTWCDSHLQDEQRRRGHQRSAGTRVIRTRGRTFPVQLL